MKCVYEQFVEEITDFSSQYGSTGSISYVATNICGESSLYPNYGDFCGSYSLQTYGNWWKISPSTSPVVPDSHPFFQPSIDFVDLLYETAVLPLRIHIYEIYNPGSVVRIWGSFRGREWILLWSGMPTLQLAQSRIFSPPIVQSNQLINLIRIEFDQSIHDYHCGFEAVLLVGSAQVSNDEAFVPKSITNSLRQKGIDIYDMKISEENIVAGVKFLLSDELQNIESFYTSDDDSAALSSEENHERKDSDEPKGGTTTDWSQCVSVQSQKCQEIEGGYFSMLPGELIIHIMKLVDLRCLCRLSCTCKMLNSFAACPLFYQNINFKNCWWLVDDTTFIWLTPLKCSQLKALDLSWCGAYDRFSSQSFMEFINQCGHNLTILHLNNCHFVDNYCLYIIANTCSKLEALSLSSCQRLDHLGFGELKKLTKLKYLDLSRTAIKFEMLHIILQSVNQLNHLIIHHCNALDIDKVAQTLKTFNQDLISLGAWKTHGLTFRGLKSLSLLYSLEELDVGWAIDRFSGAVTEGLADLVRKCINLKKLFMTAFRGLCDEDLDLLSAYGSALEQVDLMGSRHISTVAVLRLLDRCKKLKLLDVSYCEQIHGVYIQHLRVQFPDVAIKGGQKSHVSLS